MSGPCWICATNDTDLDQTAVNTQTDWGLHITFVIRYSVCVLKQIQFGVCDVPYVFTFLVMPAINIHE